MLNVSARPKQLEPSFTVFGNTALDHIDSVFRLLGAGPRVLYTHKDLRDATFGQLRLPQRRESPIPLDGIAIFHFLLEMHVTHPF